MVSRGKKAEGETGAELAAKAAASAATVEESEPDKGDASARPIAIRLNEYEYRRLKSLFAKEGVKLSTGVKTAALWVAEKIDDGALKITRAGIIDKQR
jgi:hypothetical protein